MSRQPVPCTHCHGSGWVKGWSTGRRRSAVTVNGQRFETTVAALPFSSGSNGLNPGPIDRKFDPELAGALSPGESRRSTLYHQWSISDIGTSLALAGVSGTLVGLSSVPICVAFEFKWYWPLIIWTGATTIVWAVKAKDFFDNDKAVLSSQEQERMSEPAPIIQEPPAAEIVINSGNVQKRAKLRAPRTNHAGLWQYADALVRKTAAPSYEGGEHVLGAKAYGYTQAEYDGRSDCWRPTAIAGGILEKDPEKSRGYRLTDSGRRALARVAEHRLGEWG